MLGGRLCLINKLIIPCGHFLLIGFLYMPYFVIVLTMFFVKMASNQ